MTWNGSGTVNLLYDWSARRDAGAPDHFIDADLMDAQQNDIADAIEACLNRNGENQMAADLHMGTSYHLTNMAAGSAAADSITMRQVADNSVLYGGTTGGSSSAYTLTDAVMSSAPAAGMRLLLIANHTNAGATTFNLNSSGAVAVVERDGATALSGGEIVSGDFFEVAFDGTSWVLLQGSLEFQPLDAGLTSIAGLTTAADKMIYTTASDTYATTDLTSFARTVLDDTSASAARTTLGVAIGSNVQAYDAGLTDIAGLAVTDGNIIVGDGANWVAESGATARTSLGLGTGNTPEFTSVNLSGSTAAIVDCGAEQSASDNDGTKSSGTYTPNPDGGNIKHIVNGGAFTFAPPAEICSLVVEVTNNATAGAVTTSGFTLQDGDTITTTNGHKFLFYVTKTNTYSYCNVKALQ